ncbi:hypothetical protein DLAC_09532 [Tieghemostelium lacteum]|uniref:Uncharacterized protein n=1 Tax=Tieghemostelium lacteum TaxID=361077 RepID=A0A151Z6I3_TIELA|nr:hypothetical protein DLAC_09532 [Tieghemostelium lacteum]|eukprot:KYQ89576.1 hypothetical protein DLAC_09532 [Tieghemostelium lacteum]
MMLLFPEPVQLKPQSLEDIVKRYLQLNNGGEYKYIENFYQEFCHWIERDDTDLEDPVIYELCKSVYRYLLQSNDHLLYDQTVDEWIKQLSVVNYTLCSKDEKKILILLDQKVPEYLYYNFSRDVFLERIFQSPNQLVIGNIMKSIINEGLFYKILKMKIRKNVNPLSLPSKFILNVNFKSTPLSNIIGRDNLDSFLEKEFKDNISLVVINILKQVYSSEEMFYRPDPESTSTPKVKLDKEFIVSLISLVLSENLENSNIEEHDMVIRFLCLYSISSLSKINIEELKPNYFKLLPHIYKYNQIQKVYGHYKESPSPQNAASPKKKYYYILHFYKFYFGQEMVESNALKFFLDWTTQILTGGINDNNNFTGIGALYAIGLESTEIRENIQLIYQRLIDIIKLSKKTEPLQPVYICLTKLIDQQKNLLINMADSLLSFLLKRTKVLLSTDEEVMDTSEHPFFELLIMVCINCESVTLDRFDQLFENLFDKNWNNRIKSLQRIILSIDPQHLHQLEGYETYSKKLYKAMKYNLKLEKSGTLSYLECYLHLNPLPENIESITNRLLNFAMLKVYFNSAEDIPPLMRVHESITPFLQLYNNNSNSPYHKYATFIDKVINIGIGLIKLSTTAPNRKKPYKYLLEFIKTPVDIQYFLVKKLHYRRIENIPTILKIYKHYILMGYSDIVKESIEGLNDLHDKVVVLNRMKSHLNLQNEIYKLILLEHKYMFSVCTSTIVDMILSMSDPKAFYIDLLLEYPNSISLHSIIEVHKQIIKSLSLDPDNLSNLHSIFITTCSKVKSYPLDDLKWFEYIISLSKDIQDTQPLESPLVKIYENFTSKTLSKSLLQGIILENNLYSKLDFLIKMDKDQLNIISLPVNNTITNSPITTVFQPTIILYLLNLIYRHSITLTPSEVLEYSLVSKSFFWACTKLFKIHPISRGKLKYKYDYTSQWSLLQKSVYQLDYNQLCYFTLEKRLEIFYQASSLSISNEFLFKPNRDLVNLYHLSITVKIEWLFSDYYLGAIHHLLNNCFKLQSFKMEIRDPSDPHLIKYHSKSYKTNLNTLTPIIESILKQNKSLTLLTIKTLNRYDYDSYKDTLDLLLSTYKSSKLEIKFNQ